MYVFGTFGSEEAVTVTLNLHLTANVNKIRILYHIIPRRHHTNYTLASVYLAVVL